MSHDPYTVPASQLVEIENEVASRWLRLGGAFVDGIIVSAFSIPLMFLIGAWGKTSLPYWMTLVSVCGNSLFFTLINVYFLHKDGQTLGKKVAGTRIVGLDNEKLSVKDILLKRYLPQWAVTLVPFSYGILGLIDALFIFGSERRCIHDLIAGTKVIRV